MARWRLRNPHYLQVPGTEWEYKETDRNTGKQARKVFEVPLYLDPNAPTDQNYPGEVIVCHEGKGAPKDIIFVGEPTPDMEAIDEEAEKISASLAHKWTHPIDSLPGQGYSQSILAQLERELDAANRVSPSIQALNQQKTEHFEAYKREMDAKFAELELKYAEKAGRRV